MGCSAALPTPLHPRSRARSLKSLPPDPAREPLPLVGMKGAKHRCDCTCYRVSVPIR